MSKERWKRVYEVSEGLDDIDNKPLEEVLDDLKEAGMDPAPLVKFAHQKLAAMRAAEKMRKAREERARLLEIQQRAKAIPRRAPATRGEIMSLIRDMSKASPELASAYHRKLVEAKDEDLETIIDDLEILDAADKEPNGSAT